MNNLEITDGLDIATYNSAGDNVPLYSMCNGEVILKAYDDTGFGHYIIIKDPVSKLGFLYAHMKYASNKNVGDTVLINEQVGIEGMTGYATGIHLHLEMQDLSNRNWIFQGDLTDYINPASYLGIPNVEGTTAIYYGNPVPYHIPKHKFKWVLYTRKLRERRILKNGQ